MNFDVENVQSFLERVASIVPEGFSKSQIEQVVLLADELELNEEQGLKFQITLEGKPSELHILIFMDDVDAPDIYFFSPQALAKKIDAEMERFCEELDI